MRAIKKTKPFIGIGVFLITWTLMTKLGIFNAYVLPSPAKVLESFCKMLESGELFEDIFVSLIRVLEGFFVAFTLAFVMGTFRTLVPNSAAYYEHILEFLRNVPPLSMIPLPVLIDELMDAQEKIGC